MENGDFDRPRGAEQMKQDQQYIAEATATFRAPAKSETVSSGPVYTISVFDGSRPPETLDLRGFRKQYVTFGRSPENDIILSSNLASRRHGWFELTPGGLSVHDNASLNGVSVNGCKQMAAMLKSGDSVRIDSMKEASLAGVLFMIGGSDAGASWKQLSLTGKPAFTIGRGSGCDIVLPHVSVSKVHAVITRMQDGTFTIEDCNSTNGLIVNNVRVTRPQRLREKDVIVITNSVLTYGAGCINYISFLAGIELTAIDIVRTVKSKDGPKNIANHISLDIKPREFVAIIGGSGAGKSTFMNCISGFVRATSGQVLVNGIDLYRNYDTMKSMIGYVPQQDIVYDNLSLRGMLTYTAKLRMPADTSKEERDRRVQEVIDMVELTGHESTFIRRLSGGQKKRASIAVELLSDPNLFFLDEPSSGLDPGTERTLMQMLRRMAQSGKTVISVTHNIQNLHLCDKIIFLGRGGNLCYCGSPADALKFFGVDSLVDVYNMLTADPMGWRQRYEASPYVSRIPGRRGTNEPPEDRQPRSGSGFRQLRVLCARYLNLIVNDRQKLLIMFLQAPLLAALICLVSDGDSIYEFYRETQNSLFPLACSTFWLGMLNTIQEICKERTILRREYMTGLRLFSYVSSKFAIMGMVCLIQALMLISVFGAWMGLPAKGLLMSPFAEMFISTFLATFSAAGMGLLVSAFVKNSDRAMTVAPILLMPQILFSGVIFDLGENVEWISYVINCKWAMAAYGSSANLNALENRVELDGIERFLEADFKAAYEHTPEHLLAVWGILAGMIIVFMIASAAALTSVKKQD